MIRIARGVELPPDYDQTPLRKGAEGRTVATLQDLLKSHGLLATGPTDGVFGAKTEAAVLTFQQSHALKPDGVVGPKTWSELIDPAPVQRTPPEVLITGVPRAQELLRIALAEIGAKEQPDGSNGGPQIDKYTDRWRVPWCALFVDWCLGETSWDTWGRPRMARVVDIMRWAIGLHIWVEATPGTIPSSGDLFVQLKEGQSGVDPSHGHVGIVLSYDLVTKTIRTVEGNCSNSVCSRTRPVATIDGYVQITLAKPIAA